MYEIQIYLSCRNEEKGIIQSINSVNETITTYGLDAEVIVVDNFSTDQTSHKVSKQMLRQKSLRLLQLDENKTYSGSIYASIADSTSDYVFVLDGDCQFPPSYIPLMLEKLKLDNSEIVFSNRTKLVGDPWRRFVSRFFLKLIKLTLQFDGPDINAGLRGFTKSTKAHLGGMQRGRLANASLWYQAKSANLHISFIDVTPVPRLAGTSSIPWKNPLKLFLESLIEIRKIKSQAYEYPFGPGL